MFSMRYLKGGKIIHFWFQYSALKGRKAAVMANHGAVCVGRDLEEAFLVSLQG